jgi:hypothetical protein
MNEPAFGAEGTCFTSKKEIVATNDFNPSRVKIWILPNTDRSPGDRKLVSCSLKHFDI